MNVSLLYFSIVFFGTYSIVQSERDDRVHSRRYRHNIASLGRVSRLGLRKVAQGSAQRAHRAILIQRVAGEKAALIAKSILANTAGEAAEAAEIALVTKSAVLQSLDKRRNEAYGDLVSAIAQMNLIKHTAAASVETVEKAAQNFELLAEVLKYEEEFARQAAANAEHAEVMLRAQVMMLNQAKANLENIEKQLEYAHQDFLSANKAAGEASAAAQAAYRHVSHVADDVYDGSERFQVVRILPKAKRVIK